MIPRHGDYQLAILGRLWLWGLLHDAWPSRGAPSPPRPANPMPIKFKRPCSHAPTPCEGLTTKPQCAACAHDAPHPHGPLPPPHRRPRAIATSRHFCPYAGCDYQGWRGWGTLRALAIPAAAYGDRGTVALVKATCWRRTARACMARAWRSHCSCVGWRAWPG